MAITVQWNRALGYPARVDRYLNESLFQGAGVLTRYGFCSALSQGNITGGIQDPTAAGFFGVSVQPGSAAVRGSADRQGTYLVRSSSFENIPLAPNFWGYPRLDQLILRVYDSEFPAESLPQMEGTGVPSNLGGTQADTVNKLVPGAFSTSEPDDGAALGILLGTPTSGATLDNRFGATALPTNCILLADVLIPETNLVTSANIRDRRHMLASDLVPARADGIEYVVPDPTSCVPHPDFSAAAQSISGLNADNGQTVGMVRVKHRITVQGFRLKYVQGSTALTGSIIMFVCDASGRLLFSSAPVLLTGSSTTHQVLSVTIYGDQTGQGGQAGSVIRDQTLEPGIYYWGVGLDATNTGHIFVNGITPKVVTTGTQWPGPGYANSVLYASSGGVVPPDSIHAFNDAVLWATTAQLTSNAVPMFALY